MWLSNIHVAASLRTEVATPDRQEFEANKRRRACCNCWPWLGLTGDDMSKGSHLPCAVPQPGVPATPDLNGCICWSPVASSASATSAAAAELAFLIGAMWWASNHFAAKLRFSILTPAFFAFCISMSNRACCKSRVRSLPQIAKGSNVYSRACLASPATSLERSPQAWPNAEDTSSTTGAGAASLLH